MDTSHLGTIDVSGVALKGVQALIEKVEDLKTVNSNYQNQLEQQQQMIQTLLSRIEALENQ
jgi:xylose isomerase